MTATIIVEAVGIVLLGYCLIRIVREEWRREGVFRWSEDES